MPEMRTFQPVIMAGGLGTRLWPLSRASKPKHLLPLISTCPLIVDVCSRAASRSDALPPLVLTSVEHAAATRSVLLDSRCPIGTIVLEPLPRSTAFAAAVAACIADRQSPDLLIALLPCDSWFGSEEAFHAALDCALGLAAEGEIVLLGAQPDQASTQYGYIDPGAPLGNGGFRIAGFNEKPDRETAARFFKNSCLWNTGHFVARADRLLEEIEAHAPAVAVAAANVYGLAQTDGDFVYLAKGAVAERPEVSFDCAVMERSTRGAVVALHTRWVDVGSFEGLMRLAAERGSGNAIVPKALLKELDGLYVKAGSAVIAAAEIHDVLVVVEGEFVLVAARDEDGELIALAEKVGVTDLKPGNHERVERPWGCFTVLSRGNGFQVKLIEVRAGEALSLQYHEKRAEHWVVVKGEPRITVGTIARTYKVNEHVFVPLGTEHRLENPGEEDAAIVEVQIGSYLGEDDIVRMEDRYNRP
ncbi:MAG: mannose-1-phosphate guanylyltransferase/mannose-6-phosphate isomerase [Alphaproteobacteria bacterium]